MRRSAIVLGVLLSGVATIRADDVPNLAGSWMLTGIDVGDGERPVASGYVLHVRQTGTVLTLDRPATATRRTVVSITIDPLTTTTDKKGYATTVRIENQALIVEEKRPGGCQWFSAPETGPAARAPSINCVPLALRSTYRVSADGATLEMTKLQTPLTGGVPTRGASDDEVRSLAERDGRWVFTRQ
jgi:hypothetical protein